MFNVGVIGIGSFGQKRVETLLGLTDVVSQISLFDEKKPLVNLTVQKYNSTRLKQANSVEEILNDPTIDALFICTPNSTHVEYTLAALKQNKHVLCSKPITATPALAKKIISMARKKHRVVAYGTNHRYFPSVQKAIKLVEAGELGRVVTMHASIGTNGERIQNSWFWHKELAGGGTMMDNGHHLLDLALLFCGPFSSCIGHSSRRQWTNSEVEDYAVAIFESQKKTTSGSEAVLRSSWRQPSGYLEIELWGEVGSLKIEVGQKELLTTRIGGNETVEDFSSAPKDSLKKELIQFFSDCSADSRDSEKMNSLLRITQMIDAFYTSESSGRKVQLKP